jgi:hypothetical protein
MSLSDRGVGSMVARMASRMARWVAAKRARRAVSRNSRESRRGVPANRIVDDISNVLLKLHASDRARLMSMALEAGMGQAGKG